MPVDRLYHRQLLARLSDIAIMEKKWNCKIIFPGTEQASDEVTFTGPQWQVPLCVDEFLVSLFSSRESRLCDHILTCIGHGS